MSQSHKNWQAQAKCKIRDSSTANKWTPQQKIANAVWMHSIAIRGHQMARFNLASTIFSTTVRPHKLRVIRRIVFGQLSRSHLGYFRGKKTHAQRAVPSPRESRLP